MTADKDFAILVGKAFLREVERGNNQSAIAFGRAFLLSIGANGPVENARSAVPRGKTSDNLVVAEN
jgi:hypothetical protein